MDIFAQQLINGLVLGSIYALVALGYTMVYGVLGLINFAHGEVVMIGAMVAGAAWMRSIDEAAREAHKWAWWWGGSGGMAVGSVLLLTLMLRAEDQSLSAKLGSTPANIFVSGMMCLLLFQVAGYSLAWAGWWLKHR